MQISSTANAAAYTTTVKETSKTQEIQTSKEKFDISSLENKNPEEITFKEYKNLSEENIEQLFPKDSMPEENEKAMALYNKVNISDDKILNEVLFEKELEAADSEVEERTLRMIDFLGKNWSLATSFESYERTNKYMKENNIPFSIEKFSQVHQQIEKNINYEDNNNKMTAEKLFEIFENNQLGYEASIEFYKYTSHDKEYQDFKKQIAYRESIKAAYEQKLNEQNAALDAYTRNTKQNPIAL